MKENLLSDHTAFRNKNYKSFIVNTFKQPFLKFYICQIIFLGLKKRCKKKPKGYALRLQDLPFSGEITGVNQLLEEDFLQSGSQQ